MNNRLVEEYLPKGIHSRAYSPKVYLLHLPDRFSRKVFIQLVDEQPPGRRISPQGHSFQGVFHKISRAPPPRVSPLTTDPRHSPLSTHTTTVNTRNHLVIQFRLDEHGGFPFISLSTPPFFHNWHILSPVAKHPASLNTRHCAHASSLKHATWWKIHLKPHVYKGFPFISLSTTPIFAYLTHLVARCKTFRHAEYSGLCACNLVEDPPQTPCL